VADWRNRLDQEVTVAGTSKGAAAGAGGSGAVYGLGLIGAFLYYWQNADGFWPHVWSFVEAILWPAFVVYDLLQHLH
jgi:hypothetical protein